MDLKTYSKFVGHFVLILSFADGTKKNIMANGEEETLFNDGTVQRVNAQKIKTIEYANGQKVNLMALF
mgnify:CR=1 FL=1